MGFNVKWINGIVGVEWSVFVEFSFYLVFPILMFIFDRYRTWLLIFALFVSVMQSYCLFLLDVDIKTREFLYNQPTAQLCFFVAGMYVAHIKNNKQIILKEKIIRDCFYF